MITANQISEFIKVTIEQLVAAGGTVTRYRRPLVAFTSSDDPRFGELRQWVDPDHMLPRDLLPGARSVVAFFLPFSPQVVEANSKDRRFVSYEWTQAYVETNALISRITDRLIELLAQKGVQAAAEPPTNNFDPVTLVSRWSHKSVAVIAGLGSFGLHHQVITDSGCCGRFGSLVLDAELPVTPAPPRERCLYFHDESCLECVQACPAAALGLDNRIDKQACRWYLLNMAGKHATPAVADVCGKCSTGPCALSSAV
jgi:epoxyqueuosine reductase QueG